MIDDLNPTPAELQLIDAAKAGTVSDLQSKDSTANDPATGTNWGPERTVRAAIIYALAVGTNPKWPAHARGVRLKGAKIVDVLNFEAAELPHPLALLNCYIQQPMNFENASAHSIFLKGCHTVDINADGLRTRHDLFLSDGLTVRGGVSLCRARISGILQCGAATFEKPGDDALFADGLSVGGDVFLRQGFKARGIVRLLGANIAGDLDCETGYFENPDGEALSADGITIGGDALFNKDFRATGMVRLLGAKIGGSLECHGGIFDESFSADGITVAGDVFLDDQFNATGGVGLPGANIGGDLDCDGGNFKNPDDDALSLERATIRGSVFLRDGFKATAEVNLLGASIGGDLICTGGTFENPGSTALNAIRLSVGGGVFLSNEFKATGEVNLVAGKIGSNLDCSKGTFENPQGTAINSERIVVEGSVFLQDCNAIGTTSLLGAKIGGDVQCAKAVFDNAAGISLNIEGAYIGRSLSLHSLSTPPSGKVDLSFAHVGQLVDDPASWPAHDLLILQGFVYESLAGPTDAKRRSEWLGRQPADQFRPQPYEQLIKVLRDMGHDRDAQAIAVAKQAALRKSGELGALRYLWNLLLGVTVRYGYHPTLIIAWMAPIVLLGGWIFSQAYHSCLMVPTKERIYLDKTYSCSDGAWILPAEYPRFHPIVYSLDVFFPVVDLRQKAYWEPSDTTQTGLLYRSYFWLHTVIGWLLSALAVAGLTRLVKRE
jgi:hypothetical protein